MNIVGEFTLVQSYVVLSILAQNQYIRHGDTHVSRALKSCTHPLKRHFRLMFRFYVKLAKSLIVSFANTVEIDCRGSILVRESPSIA